VSTETDAANEPASAKAGGVRKIGLAAFWSLAALAMLAWATGALDQISLSGLVAHRDRLDLFVDRSPAAAVIVYILIFAVLTGLGLPIALTLTLIGGALLGPFLGGGATVVGATGGATLTYVATRSAFGPWIARRARRGKRLEQFIRRARDNPFALMLSARLMPLFPFGPVNIAAGLASIPPWPFVLATMLGAIPSSFIYSSLGAALDRTLAESASIPSIMTSPAVFWPLLALAALALAPLVVRRVVPRLGP
jgi:uncharacterized membrane protein YdjX (TVP38/TMEM64 family)